MKFIINLFAVCLISGFTISCKTVNTSQTEQSSNHNSVESTKITIHNKTDALEEIHESADAVLTPTR